MLLIYNEEFAIRQSDLDCYDNAKISTYLDLFQTVASNHAEQFGMGFAETHAKGIAWVITKIKLDIFTPLRPGERVRVETFPHPKGRIDYTRDYFVYKPDGTLAAKGSSQWVHIDFSSRKILRPTLEFDGEFVDRAAYESTRIEKVDAITAPPCFTYAVTPLDFDHNEHVNNARYADMLLCADCSNRVPKRVIINFVGEGRKGDAIDISVSKPSPDLTLYTGTHGRGVCFTARYEW